MSLRKLCIATVLLLPFLGASLIVDVGVRAASSAAVRSETKTETLYAVSAHPDDEYRTWPFIEGRASTYTIVVILTRGEATRSCMSPGESAPTGDPELGNGVFVEGVVADFGFQGPYRYQGPGSPVGEPDKGERAPLGYPWQGKGTPACKAARTASWHWFLDAMAESDETLPDMEVESDPLADDDYRGEFCSDAIGCALVWANDVGARVAFDLGDSNLMPTEVTAALQTLRESRGLWGIRELPEAGVLAASRWSDGSGGCVVDTDGHPDHGAVHQALFEVDLGAGPQYGNAGCPTDPRYVQHPGPVFVEDPIRLFRVNEVDPVTEQRIGPRQVAYGWLWDTYSFASTNAFYWKRFD